MASEEMKAVVAMAKDMGLEGEALAGFISSEQARLRDERAHAREMEKLRLEAANH